MEDAIYHHLETCPHSHNTYAENVDDINCPLVREIERGARQTVRDNLTASVRSRVKPGVLEQVGRALRPDASSH